MSKWKHFIAAVLLGASTQAWAAPILSFSTGPAAQVGSTVTYNIAIDDIADLYSYQFSINYDARYLRALNVTEGAFLGTAGSTVSGVLGMDTGLIDFVYGSLLGPIPGASGSGLLASITFEAIGAGTSALSFADAIFLDSVGDDIAGLTALSGQGVVLADPGGPVDVPEPASVLLFGAGLAGAAALRRRRTGTRA
ncbi:VPLPA-CTERM sorting domain-containing protein [Oxalobacteraceae sp. CFBP 13730]|nr:VPLPA-CTERM sorting domain-containing protein [Oxalobacteraceae sp. CFBP 13730]